MRIRSAYIISACATILTLAVAVGGASANRIARNNQFWRAVWTPVTLKENAFGATIRCNMTLEGSFHSRTVSKVVRSLVGYVTRAIGQRPCTGGEFWIYNGVEVLGATTLPNSLPWHMQYGSFSGTLPNITRIRWRIIGFRKLVSAFGFASCIYTSKEAEPLIFNAERNTATGEITSVTAEEGVSIVSETAGCPSFRLSGPSTFTLLGTTTKIIVTLVQ
jgi:hypothetical protein